MVLNPKVANSNAWKGVLQTVRGQELTCRWLEAM